MAIQQWQEWADKIPLEERRAFVTEESRKAFELADKVGMYCVMIIWIAGIMKPECQKSVALFDNVMDAERQKDVWDKQYTNFVHEIYTFW